MKLSAEIHKLLFVSIAPARANTFVKRPWRERLRFALAVFFLFCTVGTLSVLINHTAWPMPLRFVLVTMLCSGIFAAVFILIFGRFVIMIVWIALFVASMLVVAQWGKSIQKEVKATAENQQRAFANEETRAAVAEYQNRMHRAILRDVILTLVMIVSSYIAFIQAFNHEWEKRAVVESELKIARRIQESLLPQAEKRIGGWHMFGVLQPANTVAGDYFDYLEFAGGKLGVLVADASGHGVAAGLVMTMIKSQLFSLAAETHDAQKFFERLNYCVRALAPKNMFVTAAYVALSQNDSADSPEIEITTAGHPPVLRYSAAAHQVEELHTPSAALGLQSGFSVFPRRVALQAGDVLLLHTDGICEQMNAKKEQWGLESLKAELQQHHDLALPRLCERIMKAGAEHRGNTAAHDDMTLVAVRREENSLS